jgi:hypothetical protein
VVVAKEIFNVYWRWRPLSTTSVGFSVVVVGVVDGWSRWWRSKRSPTEAFDVLKEIQLSVVVAKEIFNGYWLSLLRSTISVGFGVVVVGVVDGWSRWWRSKRSPTEAFEVLKEIQLSVVVDKEIFNGYWLSLLRSMTGVGFVSGFGFGLYGSTGLVGRVGVDGFDGWQ